MERQNPGASGALVRLKSRDSIVPSALDLAKYSEARSPLSPSGRLERSLPGLTDAIEFLERIRSLKPSFQQRAIRLYSSMKGIDQQHLYRIASIRFDSAGGASS